MTVFDARQLAESVQLEPFTFVGMDGIVYELPNAKSLSTELAQRFGAEGPAVLAEVDTAAYRAMQAMPVHVAEQLAQAWVAHGGEPGKPD